MCTWDASRARICKYKWSSKGIARISEDSRNSSSSEFRTHRRLRSSGNSINLVRFQDRSSDAAAASSAGRGIGESNKAVTRGGGSVGGNAGPNDGQGRSLGLIAGQKHQQTDRQTLYWNHSTSVETFPSKNLYGGKEPYKQGNGWRRGEFFGEVDRPRIPKNKIAPELKHNPKIRDRQI